MTPTTQIDWQPPLRGDLVCTRPLTNEDFDALYQVARDPLIWAQHPEPERCQPAVFRRYFDSGIKCRGALLVSDAQTGEIIGSSRFDEHRPATSSVEIGYTFLSRRCWGGAYNRELKRLMLEYALSHVRNVYFVVGQNNLRSQTAMRKLGARLLPREHHADLPLTGDLSAHVVFLIDQEIFAAL